MTVQDLEQQIKDIAEAALEASHQLAALSTDKKNRALQRIAELLEDPEAQDQLLKANKLDIEAGQAAELSSALLERLSLSPDKLAQMAEGVRQVAALEDPVGEILENSTHPKGFEIRKVRVPIGVIGIIYESRPNVTVDCAALCLKSGNATILRGGREAFHSNQALMALINQALAETKLPGKAVQLIPTTDRYALNLLLKLDDCIHCIIPRGGEGLIRFVAENARMPVIKHYAGVCSIYIDTEADPAIAKSVTVNAKCQRPSVCNAAENLIVHRDVLESQLPEIARALIQEGVEVRVDEEVAQTLRNAGDIPFTEATEADWSTEYLDKIIAIKAVASTREAIDFINHYGSSHSDAIVTRNKATATQFQTQVDSATVYHNVSTRFTDGFEFGLGAEIGISTDKLHARGPMGLRELTSYKFVINGNGQIK